MVTSTVTLQKKLKGIDLSPLFDDIPVSYQEKYLNVVVFLDWDEEDIELFKNQRSLKEDMEDSLSSGISSFNI